MWHLLVWGLVALLASGWSLACWALHGLLSGLGGATDGDPGWTGLEQWRIPAWLADWLPMGAITSLKAWLTAWQAAWGPWLESLFDQAPALLHWLTPLLWLAWAAGLLALALLGLVGSVLVVALRSPGQAQKPG